MANICNNIIVLEGSIPGRKRISEALHALQPSVRLVTLTEFAEKLGAPCGTGVLNLLKRGEITDFIESDDDIIIYSDTAWNPTVGYWKFICSELNLSYSLKAEEPNCRVFQIYNDPNESRFPENWYLDVWDDNEFDLPIDTRYFSKAENVLSYLNNGADEKHTIDEWIEIFNEEGFAILGQFERMNA